MNEPLAPLPPDGPARGGRPETPWRTERRLEAEGQAARGAFFGGLRLATRSEFVATLLLAANCAVFAAMVTTGTDAWNPRAYDLVQWGALVPALARDDEPWRYLTACFLHVGVLHLAVNMFSLHSLRIVEVWFGHLGFAVLYVGAGLFGSLASAGWSAPITVSAGASGAIFGMLGAILGAAVRWRRAGVDARVTGPVLKSVGNTVLVNALLTASIRGIDHAAHVGGFVSGTVLGYFLAHAPTFEAIAGRARRAGVVAAVAALAIGAAAFALHRSGIAALAFD